MSQLSEFTDVTSKLCLHFRFSLVQLIKIFAALKIVRLRTNFKPQTDYKDFIS